MPLFITFEGGEGSGKSTQARLLYRRLNQLDVPVVITHEPGVTSLGKKVTRLLKWQEQLEISPMAELLLFNVSRAQLVEKVIRPALDNSQIVICDRFADSSVAYQGYGRGLEITLVEQVNDIATAGLKPDLTFFLDMPAEAALSRIKNNKDRFEKESAVFHER
ncbi:MAG: dTMP kinase, partial [Dehalococcoidia bacterium]